MEPVHVEFPHTLDTPTRPRASSESDFSMPVSKRIGVVPIPMKPF